MNGIRTVPGAILVFLAVMLVSSTTASAQPGRDSGTGAARLFVFGTGGYDSLTDDESHLGRGFAFGGGVGYRLTPKLSAEGVVFRLTHNRQLTYLTGPFEEPHRSELTGSAVYVLGQIRYAFSTSAVRPYVAGSLGVVRYAGRSWSSVFPDGNPEARTNVTARAIGGTVGLDAQLGKVLVGPYAGLLLANMQEVGSKYALHGGVRVGYGW